MDRAGEAVLPGPAVALDEDGRREVDRPFEKRDLAGERAAARREKGLESRPPSGRPLGRFRRSPARRAQDDAAKRPVSFSASPQSRSRA